MRIATGEWQFADLLHRVVEAELGTVFPELAWFEDALRGDDAGDEFRWGDVEGRVPGGAAGVGHAHGLSSAAVGDSPGVKYFVLRSFLDRDAQAGLEFPIDRRKREGYVKRNVVALGQDGFGVGANFVGYLTGAAKRAVAADDDEVDLAALHQVTCSIVGDDVV